MARRPRTISALTNKATYAAFDVERLPSAPDPERLPRYADRRFLALLHTHYFGPQSYRTLENWPLDWRLVNGKAVAEVRQFLAEAQRRFDEAPVIRGGRSNTQQAA
jgi:hypothetical protein